MATKTHLSKRILEMKFMKKTKIKVEKEKDALEGMTMYSNEITEKMLNSTSQYIIDNSFIRCENLLEGRFSFGGMNPEIERILELEQAAVEAESQHENKKDISDNDMIKFYKQNSSNVNFVSNKRVANYQQQKPKKRKFHKPDRDN